MTISFATVMAQSNPPANTTATAGWTPLSLQPGAPAGSYALGDFDNINFFNGHLNFRLPLMQVGGRGRAGYTMMLPIEQNWIVQTMAVPTCDQSGCTYYESNYSYIANPIWWTGLQPGYGPGVLQGRQAGSDEATAQACPGPVFTRTLTRLTFTGPDGTEIELRDAQTGGQPLSGAGCTGGPSRGKVFVSADGSAATFISEADLLDERQPHFPNVIYPTGYLMLRDGTRYRINNGKTDWIRDANGNKVSFTYNGNDLVSIDDSLNRHITFSAAGISFRGANGVTRTIKIYSDSLGNVLRTHPNGSTEFTLKTFSQLFPNLQNPQQGTFNPSVVKAVELPDGRKYEFRYDSYSNLAQLILPTGGRIEYDWIIGTYQFGDHVFGIYKRVIERRTALNATTSTYETRTLYPVPAMISGGPTEVTVDSVDPKNGDALLSRTKHYFYGEWLPASWTKATDYPAWREGREYQTEFIAADGTTVLRRINNTWQQKANVSWWTLSPDLGPANDTRLVDTTTTLVDTNQVTRTTAISPIDGSVGFDQYNNQTDLWIYDYGPGVAGPLLRHTHTNYLTSGYDTLNPVWNNADLSLTYHIRNLPIQISVFDAAGSEKGRTTYEYDNCVLDSAGFHAGLVDRPTITGHDSSLGTSFVKRGNVTAVSQYLLPAGTAITSYSQYDIAGNITRVLDPRSTSGNIIATSIGYDDNFGTPDASLAERFSFPELGSQQTFAFPTQVTNAVGQIGYNQYDYGIGQVVNQQDFNGVVSAAFHDDLLDRLTQIRRAYGTPAESHSVINYDDASHTITTTGDQLINNDGRLVSASIYDGFGRTVETRQYEGPSNYIAVQVQYDALNRPFKTSSPCRPAAPDNEVAQWTTHTYDALGRLRSTTTPDNALVSMNPVGNAVTVYDQLGKARKSVSDAFGRLKTVYEDPGGLNYQTDYVYDTLDNLTSVTQGTQPSRTFVYDSLKRLTSATNPENGTVSYQYSNAGGLIVRTDARGVSMHVSYDALNRITRRWYNGSSLTTDTTHNSPALPSTVGTTDEANFYYDSQALPTGAPSYTLGTSTGRLIAVSYGGVTSSAGDYFGYDSAGRSVLKVQRTGGVNYQMGASLNVSGGINTVTYPSGRVVNYTYDVAGRTSAVTGNLGDGTTRNYSTEIIYSPFGGLTKEKFGTDIPVYNKLFYNSRGQLSEIRDSTSWTGATDTTWNRGAIINHYSEQCWGMCGGSNSATAMTDNNGNLRKQEVYIPNDDQISGYTQRWQQYDYDNLNRLNWAREIKDGTEQWRQWFKYDRWGNRTIDFTQDPDDPHPRTYGVTSSQFKIDPQTNQLYAPNDAFLPNNQANNLMKYDQSGNLQYDTYSGAGNRTYDAENRITSAWGGNNQAQLYSYDASGQRVKRTADGVQSFQVYGFGGELVAEYAASGAAGSPTKEYGYRNGQLLVAADVSSINSVAWTSAVGVTVSGNSLSKPGGDGWDAGAVSTQTISSGDGYVEFTAAETNKHRRIGLSNGNSNQSWDDIDYCIYLEGSGTVYINEGPTPRGSFGSYASGDVFRVAVEGGVVKYRKNGTLLYTSTISPTYPLLVDTALYSSGATLTNVLTYVGTSAANIHWLVTDQLGTTRMILDQTGALANVKRHDYMPFGEELVAPTGGRSQTQGYSGDGVRQQFTAKERDVETGLDYFLARYYSSSQGRFVSVDPLMPSARASHPQTWNRYSYVLNNPLIFTDSTGMVVDTMGEDELEEKKAEQAQRQQQTKPPQQPAQQQPDTTPTTVTANVGDPKPYGNLPLGPNNYFSGMASLIEFTVKDQNGDPMSNITVSEDVTPASTVQNSRPVNPDDGRVVDLVGRGSFGPRLTNEEARAEARDARNKPNNIVQDHAMFIMSSSGRAAIATHQRTFSNVDANGNLNPVVSTKGYSNNYTIIISEIKVFPVRPVICPRFR